MKKKIAVVLTSTVLVGALFTGCSGNTAGNTTPQTATEAPQGDATNASQETTAGAELTAGMYEGPVLLTSVGQSADVSIVETLFKKAEVSVTTNATADKAALSGVKTLVLAVGGSSKGLGAAGIDENQELARVQELITEAKAQGIKILALHIGGSARRGTLSDKFIPDAFSNADGAIVVKEGDSDNMMSSLLQEKSTPSAFIDSQIDAVEVIQTVFTK